MNRAALLGALLLASGIADAQQGPTLVRDFNTTPMSDASRILNGSFPFRLGDSLYFWSTDSSGILVTNPGLWKTDGTPEGTQFVKGVSTSQGPTSAPVAISPAQALFTVLAGREPGLWTTDGTTSGTRLIKADPPGYTYLYPPQLTLVGSTMYFLEEDLSRGYCNVLWKSDGTERGTTRVADTSAGCSAGSISLLGAAGPFLLFTTNLPGLWRSDGTEAGTVSINPTLRAAAIGSMNGVMYLLGTVGPQYFDFDYELWRTDGTPEGTYLVKDMNPGPAGSNLGRGAAMGGLFFFTAFDGVSMGLYRTDGTRDGTVVVKRLPGTNVTVDNGITVVSEGKMFFVAAGAPDSQGLWMSDGTESGTARISELAAFNLSGRAGNLLYLTKTDVSTQLWQTDGHSEPALLATLPGYITALPSGFFVNVGSLSFFTFGPLWQTDGTPSGTHVTRILPPATASSGFGWRVTLDRKLIFSVNNGAWATDGSQAGTKMLLDCCTSQYATALGNRVFFIESDHGLWGTEGTPSTTLLVRDFSPEKSTISGPLWDMGKQLFFTGSHIDDVDHSSRIDLWKSDGTASGTQRITTFPAGNTTTILQAAAVLDGKLFFNAYDSVHGLELWISDGTDAGTHILRDINPGKATSSVYASFPYFFSASGGFVLFPANDGVHGAELWRSDGSESGTFMVKDIASGDDSLPAFLGEWNGVVYFAAWTPEFGYELWRTDGTEEETRMIADILPGSRSSYPNAFTPMGDFALFIADDGSTGYELWRTDGTAAGTRRLADINPGPEIGVSGSLTRVGNVVYFSGEDDRHGSEVWRSDGTEEGTFMLGEVSPGPAGSYIDGLTSAGNVLYFSAYRADLGIELWMIPICAGDLPCHTVQGPRNAGTPRKH